jgi:glycosyltransferase involved in cell wall biosynthesis
MNIAMAHSNFSFAGGVERYVLEVSQRLAARHHVTLYTSKYIPSATYPGLSEWPIVTIPAWKWATTLLKEDVIITHNHGPNLLAYRNKNVAYLAHSFMNDSATIRPDIILRRLLDREAKKRNQRILANSKFTATRFQALYHRPVTDVVYGGIDPGFFNLYPKTGDYALYVGRFDPTKGLDRLVAWWQSIDYDLVMVGGGDPTYMRALMRYNNPHITILEPKFGEELAKIYQNCRFFVFLPFAETLGLVALEAMAASKPVIGANAGALTETIIHGTTGFLINSEEEFCQAVTHLITSEQACQDMGAAGRQHAQQYTWDNITQHIEQICQEMVECQDRK